MTDLNQVALRWNRAISLRQPTASTVASQLHATPQRVFEDAPEFLYLGDNLVLKLPPATQYSEGASALSIALVLKKDFFASDALIQTVDLPRFGILGTTVSCSAQVMLDHLSGADARCVSTATEPDRWTIQYGKGISLLFLPFEGTVGDPQQSALAMVEFFYSLPFQGLLSAEIEAVPAHPA